MTHNEASGAGTSRSRLDNVAPAPISFLRRPKPFDRDAAMRAYEKEHPEALQTRMQALRSRHAGTSLKVFPNDPQRFFEAGFTEILATRMAGLPIVNAKLSVAATPFVRILIDQTQAWIGVVVTQTVDRLRRDADEPAAAENVGGRLGGLRIGIGAQ